jgi:REP element-mobilizing transposase RayT
MDRYLDTTRTGPMWLGRREIASQVATQILKGATESLYELHAWVVMRNHVHLLVHPHIEPGEIMRRLKGRTAREANLLLSRSGGPFWQAESYDRWMRNEKEIVKVARYIENNPVVAGLAARPDEYEWSSAWRPGTEAPVAS